MRVGVAWCTAQSQPLEHIASAISAAGFRSLALPAAIMEHYLSNHSLIELDRYLQGQNVYLDAISDALPLVTSREERLLQQARFLERCMMLDALGGGILTIQIHFANPDIPTSQAVVKQAANLVGLLSDTAAPFAIQLALGSMTCLSSTVKAEIAARVDRPNVGWSMQLEEKETPLDAEAWHAHRPPKLWSIYLADTWSEPSNRDRKMARQQLAAHLQTWHKQEIHPLLAVCLSTRYATLQQAARAAMQLVTELGVLSDALPLIV